VHRVISRRHNARQPPGQLADLSRRSGKIELDLERPLRVFLDQVKSLPHVARGEDLGDHALGFQVSLCQER
jgi:hypothetical protein